MSTPKTVKTGKAFSAKMRIGVLFGSVIALGAIAAGVWHHYRTAAVYQGQVDVTGAPIGIHNTPGATAASDNYIATQNAQNAKLSQEAKNDLTSSVPTITRPSFMDNADSFQATADQPAPQACPMSKVVYMYRPNPANCSPESLRLARESGVTADELRCQACGCPALRAAGYTVGQLRDTGLGASELQRCGFDLSQLIGAGFSAQDLKQAGFTAATLRAAGLSAGELAAAGFSAADLQKAGFTAQQIAQAGAVSKAAPLVPGKGACSVAALRQARAQGASPAALKDQGCDVAALRAAGFTAAEMKAAGFDAGALAKAGYSTKDLKDAGYSAASLVRAGISPAELRKAGFSAAALHDAGVSASALKAAGFTAAALKQAGVSAAELQQAGFTAGELRNAGYGADELKAAGFNAKQLRDAGYSAAEMKQAGLTPQQLQQAGFTGGDLLRAGFSAAQAGYAAPAAPAASAPAAAAPVTADVPSAIPSIEGGTQAAQLRRLQEAQQQLMTQQQRQDAVQQMQGQMMMQATKMMAGWSNAATQTVQRAVETPVVTAAGAGAAGNGAATMTGPTIKAGTIMFGVLDTAINSDEANTPVMATIVSGELKGAKLVGQFTRVDKKVMLTFNVVNVPSFSKSFTANVVAIDPNTARTAMAGYVDNHYLLRFGSLFASAFLSGISQGIQQSNSTTSCLGPFCSRTYGNLRPSDYVWMGLGRTGEQYATNMSSDYNRPPTVTVPGGVGLGLLFMADAVLPEPLPTSTEGGQ